jgi:DNA-binding winged helix-turn-helix (wHTH) protein
MRELVLRLRALDRRRAHNRPPIREIANLRLDPFRREVYRDGRHVALTRKQFAVLEVLVEADGGVVSAEELLERAWDENADPFTNAVRITISGLRKRLGEPQLVATVPGVGYRVDTGVESDIDSELKAEVKANGEGGLGAEAPGHAQLQVGSTSSTDVIGATRGTPTTGAARGIRTTGSTCDASHGAAATAPSRRQGPPGAAATDKAP